jgi:hypothetical protein
MTEAARHAVTMAAVATPVRRFGASVVQLPDVKLP